MVSIHRNRMVWLKCRHRRRGQHWHPNQHNCNKIYTNAHFARLYVVAPKILWTTLPPFIGRTMQKTIDLLRLQCENCPNRHRHSFQSIKPPLTTWMPKDFKLEMKMLTNLPKLCRSYWHLLLVQFFLHLQLVFGGNTDKIIFFSLIFLFILIARDMLG